MKYGQICLDCGEEASYAWTRCAPCHSAYNEVAYKVTRAAAAKVHKAIKRGLLPSPRSMLCVDCGKQATEYDHRDYSKPLEVEAVCHSCNKLRGPGLNNGRAAA